MGRIGEVLQSKKGGFYIKVKSDLVLKEGDVLFLNKPEDEVNSLLQRGIITQEQADNRLSKTPEFIKYIISEPKRQS